MQSTSGAHDFFTWHQTYVKFVKGLNWTDNTPNITAESVNAKCGTGETASMDVTYNNKTAGTSIRVKIDTDLEIKRITSEYNIEFNPASNYVVVYTTDEIKNGDLIFTICFDLDVAPWLADGAYRVGLNVIEATDADEKLIELAGQAGYVVVENTYAAGDVNRDGSFINTDVVMVARYLVDLTELDSQQLKLADVDKDGSITNIDLIRIVRALVTA